VWIGFQYSMLNSVTLLTILIIRTRFAAVCTRSTATGKRTNFFPCLCGLRSYSDLSVAIFVNVICSWGRVEA
jgi:hypothetical protein